LPIPVVPRKRHREGALQETQRQRLRRRCDRGVILRGGDAQTGQAGKCLGEIAFREDAELDQRDAESLGARLRYFLHLVKFGALELAVIDQHTRERIVFPLDRAVGQEGNRFHLVGKCNVGKIHYI
jgi:hypothetical protein